MSLELFVTTAVCTSMILCVAFCVRIRLRYDSTRNRTFDTPSSCGLPGAEVAIRLLEGAGETRVTVDRADLLNRYDFESSRVLLTDSAYGSTSIGGLAIAAHEVGHALQFKSEYWVATTILQLWRYRLPCFVVLSAMIVLGQLTGHTRESLWIFLSAVGVMLFVYFSLVALLEIDANRRAKSLVAKQAIVSPEEWKDFHSILDAAFGTYLLVFAQTFVGMLVAIAICLDPDFHSRYFDGHAFGSTLTEEQIPLEGYSSNADPATTNSQAAHAMGVVYFGALCFLAIQLCRKPPRWVFSDSHIIANNQACRHINEGELEKALAMLNQVVTSKPSLVMARLNRAFVYETLGRNEDALNDLNAILDSRGGYKISATTRRDTLRRRGVVRICLGDWAGAIADQTAALEFGNRNAGLLSERALAYLRDGDLVKALADANSAIQLEPNDAIAFNNRGAIHIQLGNYQAAQQNLERSIAISPDFPNPKNHLATLVELANSCETVA